MMQPSPPRGLIDPNWELIDLDPVTWRTIGKFLQPALYVQAGPEEENGLFIIHDAGELLQITTSGGGDAEIGIDRVSDPRRLAVTLQNSGKWDRVHVIDRQHLRDVSRKAQTPEHSRMALDEYYRLVFHLVWDGGDGYVAEPPHPGHWNHWTYAGIEQFASQLRETAALSLGVRW